MSKPADTLLEKFMLALAISLAAALGAAPSPKPAPAPAPAAAERAAPDIERPLQWMISAQGKTGGWGGEIGSPPDVATTSISGIALLRMGHTASAGAHRQATLKAVDFVAHAIEAVPADEPAINVEGTLPQRKLGRYVDTFLAAQYLSEALPTFPAGPEHDRVAAALQTCVAKVEKLQQGDGSFDGHGGWAPVLGSAFASGALHAAKTAQAKVAPRAVAAADEYLVKSYDKKTNAFRTEGAANVQLYAVASAAQGASYGSGGVGMGGGGAGRAALGAIKQEQTLRGFGSYGGEEHISFMMTSEALARTGGKDWEEWDRNIRKRLATIQRDNGTWRGDHCITSTSFCTAATLITLAVKPTVQLPTR